MILGVIGHRWGSGGSRVILRVIGHCGRSGGGSVILRVAGHCGGGGGRYAHLKSHVCKECCQHFNGSVFVTLSLLFTLISAVHYDKSKSNNNVILEDIGRCGGSEVSSVILGLTVV